VSTEWALSDSRRAERTPVGTEFHARGPATEKALSLRRSMELFHAEM